MRRRLDSELVRRGLAVSRTEAQEAIRAGVVLVGGMPATKVSSMVGDDDPVTLETSVRNYVSRGGEKLAAALDRFEVDPGGRRCLDVGASTGGFTDCLLQRGASRVVAVDVGYGQLDWRLRNDPRVMVLERTNVRDLKDDDLRDAPGLVVADLSFISLRTVMGDLATLAAEDAEFILLVKPQFEVGRDRVGRKGVVRDAGAWRDAIEGVAGACSISGVDPAGVMASPLSGPAGNVEFLLWAKKRTPGGGIDVSAAIVEGTTVRNRS